MWNAQRPWENVAQQVETAPDPSRPRLATADDAHDLAVLLHDFNTEFHTPSPGVEALASRLTELLAGDATFAIVAGSPPAAVALVTLRTNVWYSGQVALLDEMYVVPDRRGQGLGIRHHRTVADDMRRQERLLDRDQRR